jgi:hypothetical protein
MEKEAYDKALSTRLSADAFSKTNFAAERAKIARISLESNSLEGIAQNALLASSRPDKLFGLAYGGSTP